MSIISRVTSIFGMAFFLGACAEKPPAEFEGRGLQLSVAPLNLDGIGEACYDITISGANDTVVALEGICSGQFGNGSGGSISYVAPCDASLDADTNASVPGVQNTVSLWPSLKDSQGNLLEDWQNPCGEEGCVLEAECKENEDSFVVFNLTIMRSAKQGFFDIAVNFDNIYCSAKVDCEYDGDSPIELLFDPSTGERIQTVVWAFACTDGKVRDDNDDNTATHLYMNNLVLDCEGEEAIEIQVSDGPGNLFSSAQPGPTPILQAAVYEGREALENASNESLDKLYWNVALGLDTGALASQNMECVLKTKATASHGPFDEGQTPENEIYPFIEVEVPITDAAGALVCTQHPLNGPSPNDGVVSTYTGFQTGESFDHVGRPDEALPMVTEPVVSTACGPWGIQCPSGYECLLEQCRSIPRALGWLNDGVYTPCESDCASSSATDGSQGSPILADSALYVPPGDFYMGCGQSDGLCEGYEKPQHKVTLTAGYGMDEVPVTVRAYWQCYTYGDCQSEPSSGVNSTYNVAGKELHPVNYLTYAMSVEYCTWQGKRLPTEAEWEKAARGGCETLPNLDCATNMRLYPWGDAPPNATLTNYDDESPGTTDVWAHPDGRSPYGLYGMAGNIYDRVSDYYSASYYSISETVNPTGPASGSNRTVRGGAFDSPAGNIRSSRRYFRPEGNQDDVIGFRCLSP